MHSSCELGKDPYFVGTLPTNPKYDFASHFGLLLFAMHEPSLACGAGPEQSYRVLYYPIFDPEVRATRIAHYGARAVVTSTTIKRTNGAWPITNRIEKELGLKDWERFSSVVPHAKFWSALPELPRPPLEPAEVQLDGSTWILEARADGKYRVIVRGDLEREFADLA